MSARNLLDIRKADARKAAAKRVAPSAREAPKLVRLRTKRIRHRMLVTLASIVGVITFVGILGAASHLNVLAIHDITIKGVKSLPPEALTASARTPLTDVGFRLFSHKNMFLYPKEEIATVLRNEYPQIKRIAVSRDSLFAQAIQVTIQEHEEFAKWCSPEDVCYLMDEDGFIFMPADDPLSPFYIFKKGLAPGEPIGQTFLRGRIHDLRSLFRALEREGYTPRELTVVNEKDFSLKLDHGPELKMAFDVPYADALANLQTALDAEGVRDRFAELLYIDLRFGNRVYYK